LRLRADALADRMRTLGECAPIGVGLPVTVTVTVTVTGAERPLPPADQAAYRTALMDIQVPVLDGLEATRQIVADERLDSVRVAVERAESRTNATAGHYPVVGERSGD
jgi:CheY-like chemotaxis protein